MTILLFCSPDFWNISSQTGCLGCASGKGAGPLNIFGNKYGQNLAAVQIARERRLEAKRLREEEQEKEQAAAAQQQQAAAVNNGDSDGDEETDDDTDDEDDYGPSPAAGIWAGSQKLQAETDKVAEGEEEEEEQPAAKKVKR